MPKNWDTPPRTPLVDNNPAQPWDREAKIKTPPRRKAGGEVAELKRRARTASTSSRASISVQIRVSVALYKALVELAEEYHSPISTIGRQCLEDGVRKYKEFSTPGLNPFGRVPVTRAHPQFLDSRPPTSLAARYAPAQEEPLRESSEDDADMLGLDSYMDRIKTLPAGLVLPSSPSLQETHKVSDTEPKEPDAE